VANFEDYEGSVFVNGERKTEPGSDRIMVFQDFNQLFPWKTVEKNIQYGLKLQGIRDREQLKRTSDEALRKVRLDGYQNFYPYQLSGGMKQRVAIAKAFALEPSIILMDEPFAALDHFTREKMQQALLSIHAERRCGVLFVTHSIDEALAIADRIVIPENHQAKKVYPVGSRLRASSSEEDRRALREDILSSIELS
jgi:NitT/TauT family transport system ATP-binding protein